MIKTSIYNLYHATRLKEGWGSKVGYFLSLTALGFKKSGKSDNREISQRFFNYNIFGYSYSTLDFLFREVFITHDYQFKAKTEKPVIVDCGANIGMSALYFKKLYPGCSIIAFEANPHAFKMLEKNIHENRLTGITAHNIALYDKETTLSFFISKDVGTLMGSVRPDRGGDNELKVPAQRLSGYFRQMDRIDMVKMDVEGAEINIISDLFETGTLAKAEQYIIEYHHNINNDPSALAGFLEKFERNNYNYTIKTGYISPEGFQDILIHFYRR